MIDRIQSRHLIATAVVLVLALVAGPSPVRGFAGDEIAPLEGDRLDRVAEMIDLDDATRDQIAAISREVAEENAPRRAAIRKERLLLRALLEESPPDEAAVLQQVDVLSEIQSALWKTRLRGMMRARSLLTPLQREQLVRIRQGEARESSRACRGDVRRLCPDAIDVRSSVACLIENRDEISDDCRARLSQGRLSRFFVTDE